MNIEESQLRQIIREELSKPPGWVEPPPGWTYTTGAYYHPSGSVYWDPEVSSWVATSGDGYYNARVLGPEEGFYEVLHGT
jgi:hypothetical protein